MLRLIITKRKKKTNKEKGQSLVEYGLILALVSIVAISVLTMLGTQINSTIYQVDTVLSNVKVSTSP